MQVEEPPQNVWLYENISAKTNMDILFRAHNVSQFCTNKHSKGKFPAKLLYSYFNTYILPVFFGDGMRANLPLTSIFEHSR